MSEYVAVAAGEKRLREILSPLLGEATLELVVETLTGEGVTADYKPRLKAVLLTVPMPDTKTEKPKPETGGVPPELAPEPVADEEYAIRLDGTTMPGYEPPEIGPDGVLPEPTPLLAEPLPPAPSFGGMFLPRIYTDDDDLRDVGVYFD